MIAVLESEGDRKLEIVEVASPPIFRESGSRHAYLTKNCGKPLQISEKGAMRRINRVALPTLSLTVMPATGLAKVKR